MSLVSYIVYRAELNSDNEFLYLLDYPTFGTIAQGDVDHVSRFPWLQIATVRGGVSGYRDLRYVDGTAMPGRKYLYRVTCRTTDHDGNILSESPGRILPGFVLTSRLKTRHTVTYSQALTSGTPWAEVVFNLPSNAELLEDLTPGAGVPSTLMLAPDRAHVYVNSAGNVPTTQSYEVTYVTEARVEYGYALGDTPGTTEQWVYAYRPTEGSSVMWRLLWASLPTVEDQIEEYLLVNNTSGPPLSYVEFKDFMARFCLTCVRHPDGKSYQTEGVFQFEAPELPITATFFQLAEEGEGQLLENAKRLANSLALSGLFNVLIDGAKVYVSFTTGSTALALTEEADSSNSSIYDPDLIEIHSPAPSLMGISHGGDYNYPHALPEDVVDFPTLENRFDVHLFKRSFGGQNNDPSLAEDTYAKAWLWFVPETNPVDTDEIELGISGSTLTLVFVDESEVFFPGQVRDAGSLEVLIGETIELTLQNLCNFYNNMSPRDESDLILSVGTLPYGTTVGVYLTARNEQDIPILVTDIGIDYSIRSYSISYAEETGLVRLSDADMSTMGEWSGSGFDQTAGHFHLDYDLSIVENDNPVRAFVRVDGKVYTELAVDQTVGELVIGSTGTLHLFADGTTLHSIELVKQYADGSQIIAGCKKILPRRGMLQPLKGEHRASVLLDEGDPVGVAGFVTGPFDGDNIELWTTEEGPGELGLKSGTDHTDAQLLHFLERTETNTERFRLRNVLLNGLDEDGLYSPGTVGCVSNYTPWKDIAQPLSPEKQVKITANYLIVLEQEDPDDHTTEDLEGLSQYASMTSGLALFSWLINFDFPRLSVYPADGDDEALFYSRTAKLYPVDDRCPIQSISIGNLEVLPVSPTDGTIPGVLVSIQALDSVAGLTVGHNHYFTTADTDETPALVLNDYFFAQDADGPIIYGKEMSDGTTGTRGVSFLDGNSLTEASIKPTANYLSFDRMGKTYDFAMKLGTTQDIAQPSVRVFKSQKTILIRTPLVLPAGATKLVPLSGSYPHHVSPNSRVEFNPILSDAGTWLDSASLYFCLDLGAELAPDLMVVGADSETVLSVTKLGTSTEDYVLRDGFSLVSRGRDYELRAAYLSPKIVAWTGKLLRDGAEISEFSIDSLASFHQLTLPTQKGSYTILLYIDHELVDGDYFFLQSPDESVDHYQGQTFKFNFTV